jgi:hypothetical protein
MKSEPSRKGHVKAAKQKTTADDFVRNLSLARLSMDEDASSIPTSNIEAINSYKLKKKENPQKRTLVLIEYKRKGEEKIEQLIAPVSSAGGDFPELLDVMRNFNDTPHTIQNIQLLSATIAPATIPKIDSVQTALLLDQQQSMIIARKQSLPVVQDIALQLRLAEFFIQNRFRDAAYISVDNAKRALAKATIDKSAPEEKLTELSKQLEGLEGRLHQELPFGL